MSDSIKHECGIAMVRLLKPLKYYQQKYGTTLYGFNKLFMLMEKQHNRGQDGAGIGCVKLNMPAGKSYMFRDRSNQPNALKEIFSNQLADYQKLIDKKVIEEGNPLSAKEHWDFGGEVLMGHLRYATYGNYETSGCHPYVRRSNWPTRNLMLAGNFNLTNIHNLHKDLIARGQHPIFGSDTHAILEVIGSQLDEEHNRIYRDMKERNIPGIEIPPIISEKLDPADIIRKSTQKWDGGYTIGGLIGNGDAFALRDPKGIRPAFYYQDDEIIAVASERVALLTALDIQHTAVQELKPGHVLVIKNDGTIRLEPFAEEQELTQCSFERIYFSRGNDVDIYQERKALGGALAQPVLKAIGGDWTNTIFSYIPNTAEPAYMGLMEKLRYIRREQVKQKILEASSAGNLTDEVLDDLIMSNWPRAEKIALKDIKLRTFISEEKSRSQLASHVYDVTYGVVKPEDHLVCIDDSIVRGTTLKRSILRILGRTNPKKIVIASTAPQIRYPDCYGIDMSELGKFVAFQAMVELLKEGDKIDLLDEVYGLCMDQRYKDPSEMKNYVKKLYGEFSAEEISKKIAQLVFPDRSGWNGEVEIAFQTIEGLHRCLPNHTGDWYFTGDYPTPGGYSVLNRSFINYYENKNGRSY